ncbi:MAG: N-acetylmuramic acid 6-phosphate etherase [Sphaerochaeta sp.]|jgi:N-acetylmuramic acid 6-phosphate etherase|uniref:N-acetylmuramic acid 6-phosphate etherase n=1 Tax=bioreactor metagenome TaxID=1076179 RepID=A0A644Z542_9ZZZZ|nr:N-acetylmuramic acid 6-phosphate etherase [Sphaerochaeta sp.]NCC05642.1 N-acetylmuramic acid 6-phosphate etherase [Pseudomonadota bacterium]MDD2394290.1 N-acetylmuramic acid 6-phosphate etherase [Sphaerochaeta sp.]MDD4038622.1 N-acetylmuramic acid 6-phosphate etherase [Sphaerochaeta sp.]MDD4450838.1 N-acetylmuramic acid 6-phosphate etherase [Sphaerochaeta sp.]MDX9983272.1 N-acetylmuramic acid 6-phosphate etherase [Sphaerochaeta sp.]
MDVPITQEELGLLTTEQCNDNSANIDELSVFQILQIMNNEDKTVPYAVEKQLPVIEALVTDIVASFKKGGKLVYIGAGTSGRLGVLDASECPPTFGVSRLMVQGVIAGGREALVRSIENAEDDKEAGINELKSIQFGKNDVLVGITASGQAAYVIGAMEYAKDLGAVVGAISCNKDSKTFAAAKHAVFLDVGPEIITGSTRLKAGTAQKLVLNMLTTASMIRLGKVYHNLMVDLTPVNHKLVERSKRLIKQATGCTEAEAAKAFTESGKRPKVAILMILLGVDAQTALALEEQSSGPISEMIRLYQGKNARQ